MEDVIGDRVTLTHFINPQLFWYKINEGARQQNLNVSIMEEELKELYRNKPSIHLNCRLTVGDKVVVYFIAFNKYIRAEIAEAEYCHHEKYIVWAMDYGFPLLSDKKYLYKMPVKFAGNFTSIYRGGILNIEPDEQDYNIEESKLVMIKRKQWLQKPCNMVEKILGDAYSIRFVKRFESSDNYQWGDLIITDHKGHKLNIREYLLETTFAIEVNDFDFYITCAKLKTTKIVPWLSNDRNMKLRFNTIKDNYVEHLKEMKIHIVQESAKRKVEDWKSRNERKQIDDILDPFEGNVLTEATIHESPFGKHQQYKAFIEMLEQIAMDKDVQVKTTKDTKSEICNNNVLTETIIHESPFGKHRQYKARIEMGSQSAYDGLTMVPAGFDLTRLHKM